MKNYLRTIGFIEGGSLLALLFIAMPLKYLAGIPVAVRIVGMIHGILFITYVALAFHVALQAKWSMGKMFFAWAVAVIPFGPFIFDKKIFGEN